MLTDSLKEFQASLQHEAENKKHEQDAYFGKLLKDISTVMLTTKLGLSLRELLYELRYQTLVLFKCILLQKRVRSFKNKVSLANRCVRCCSSAPDARGCA